VLYYQLYNLVQSYSFVLYVSSSSGSQYFLPLIIFRHKLCFQ